LMYYEPHCTDNDHIDITLILFKNTHFSQNFTYIYIYIYIYMYIVRPTCRIES